jgi:hypothetical protein
MPLRLRRPPDADLLPEPALDHPHRLDGRHDQDAVLLADRHRPGRDPPVRRHSFNKPRESAVPVAWRNQAPGAAMANLEALGQVSDKARFSAAIAAAAARDSETVPAIHRAVDGIAVPAPPDR